MSDTRQRGSHGRTHAMSAWRENQGLPGAGGTDWHVAISRIIHRCHGTMTLRDPIISQWSGARGLLHWRFCLRLPLERKSLEPKWWILSIKTLRRQTEGTSVTRFRCMKNLTEKEMIRGTGLKHSRSHHVRTGGWNRDHRWS